MDGTIVGIYWDPETERFLCNLSSPSIENGTALRPIDLKSIKDKFEQPLAQGALADGLVEQLGTSLAEILSAHDQVKLALNLAATTTTPGKRTPIYVRLNDKADSFAWEALNLNGKFLALDPRWPIGRIPDTTDGIAASLLQDEFSPPLRILAVLAAAGVPAKSQWDALYQPFKKSKLKARFSVYVCEPELYDELSQLADVSVDYLTQDFRLDASVNRMRKEGRGPHILHLFCHGSAKGQPHLQLATATDFQKEPAEGSIHIEPGSVLQANLPGSNGGGGIWLLTLNCCEAAAAATNVVSFARTVIDSGLFPAVVGMRETVRAEHADVFCRWLYTAAEQILSSKLVGGETAECDLVSALNEARQQLCVNALNKARQQLCVDGNANDKSLSEIAAASKEWTLPVVYVRAQPTMIRVRAEGIPLPFKPRPSAQELELARGEWKSITDYLASKPADLPESVQLHLRQRVDELEAVLFPDTVGTRIRRAGAASVAQVTKLGPALVDSVRALAR